MEELRDFGSTGFPALLNVLINVLLPLKLVTEAADDENGCV